MAIKQEDLLQFIKATEFVVLSVEDDSSGATVNNPNGTVVKILHLAQPITAVGSNPSPSGHVMKATDAKVHVAADNWTKFLEQAEVKDGTIHYKGDMHLDVSKPDGRNVNGKLVITKPAKIWLTSVKFSRSGGQLNQSRVNNLNTMIDDMFAGNQPFNLAVQGNTGTTATGEGGETGSGPVVVENQTDKDAAKNGDVNKIKPPKEKVGS